MANITKKISVNGWQRLITLLQSAQAGYDGGIARTATFINLNAAAATVHLNDDGDTQPSAATDGVPIGTTAASAPSPVLTLENVDLNCIWLNTGAAQDIVIMVNGKV